MIKKIALSSIAILVVLGILDFVIHGVILQSAYMETAHLWRPMEEMEKCMPWMYLVTLIFAVFFSTIYALLISPKSIGAGVKFGLLLGIGMGVSMGFGSYLVMPISLMIATVWFIGTVVEFTVAGLIAAAIIKD